MSHKPESLPSDDLPEPSMSKDTLYGLGQSSIFDETFMEKHQGKKPKHRVKSKEFLSIIIYLLCSILSILFIQSEAQSLSFYQASFLQSSCLIVLIPLSSLQKIFLDRVVKHHLSNEEEKDPVQQLQEDSFSELMNKKNYEHFYKYSKSYYRNTFYLILCYLISLTFHYWTLHYLNGVLCLIYFTANSVTILLMRCFLQFRKTKLIDILQLLLNIGTCVAFYVCYRFLTPIQVDYNYYWGTGLAAVSVLANTAFLYFWKSLQKKYKFYISTTETAGYMGLFSLLVTFCLVVCVALFKDGFKFLKEGVNGTEVFMYVIKVGFCGVVVDLALMKMVDHCSFRVVSNAYNIILGIVFAVYCGWNFKQFEFGLNAVATFAVSEVLVLISIVLMLTKIALLDK